MSNVYFSLGEAVAALGIIFAVYQLIDSSGKIVMRIRPFWQRYFFVFLSILGLFSTAIAAIIAQTDNFFFYSTFFEILGFNFFILAPISILYLHKTKINLFNKKNAARFYRAIDHELVKLNNQSIPEVIEIISSNIEELAKQTKLFGKITEHDGSHIVKIKLPSNLQNQSTPAIASYIINIVLGDSLIANYIATQRLDFIKLLLMQIKEHKLQVDEVLFGPQRLIDALYLNKDSYFYKHTQKEYGLAFTDNIYKLIFKDFDIQRALLPLNNLYFLKIENGKKGNIIYDPHFLKVYLKAAEITMSLYWQRDSELKNIFSYVEYAFSNIGSYGMEMCKKRMDIYSINELVKFTTSLIRLFGSSNVDINGGTGSQRDGKEISRLESFSEFIVQILESLSYSDMIVMTRASRIILWPIFRDAKDNQNIQKLQEEVVKKIWERIKNDKTEVPQLLKIYLVYFNFKDQKFWANKTDEFQKLLNFIKEQSPKKYPDLPPGLVINENGVISIGPEYGYDFPLAVVDQ